MNVKNKNVSILGCGWIGKALEASLHADGSTVHCLTRDIIANHKAGLYDVDVLVIAIPPRDAYIHVLEQTLANIDTSTQVIFLSSISFYDGKALVVEGEERVQELHEATVVLRLGGLMGYDRIAGKYTAGKVWDFDTRTNYMYRDDVVGIIERVITLGIVHETFDVVAPIQSTKKEIFTQNAKLFGFKQSVFKEGTLRGKELTPKKLIQILGYTFFREDVRTFWNT